MRAFLLLVFLVVLMWPFGISVYGQSKSTLEGETVLVLHSHEATASVFLRTDKGLIETLSAAGISTLNMHIVSLDLRRNPGSRHREMMAEQMRAQYGNRRPGMIITMYPEAVEFVVKDCADIFRGVPILALYLPRHFRASPADSLFIAHFPRVDIFGTLEIALKLVPGVKQVYVVTGAHEVDRRTEDQAKQIAKKWEGRIQFIYLSDLPFEEMVTAVSKVPQGSIILGMAYTRDVTGRNFTAPEMTQRISQISPVPIFEVLDSTCGHGIVGGSLIDFELTGKKAGQLAARILGHTGVPDDIPTFLDVPSVAKFDWQQLKRWGLDESVLPANAIVLNRPSPSFWTAYKKIIVLSVVFFIAQTLLIIALLMQRNRTKTVEKSLREKNEELDRFFSVTPDLLCIANENGYFIRLNAAWERTLGYSVGDLMEKPFIDFVHPDDKDSTREVTRSLTSGQVGRGFLNRYRCADGTYRWMEWDSVPVGGLRYAAARDVTERKLHEAEQEGRLRFEQLLSDTSARLTSAPFDRIDYEIERVLETVLQILQVDRCGLLRSFRNKPVFRITHAARAEGLPELPLRKELPASLFPYAYSTLVGRNRIYGFATVDELPEEGSPDKQMLRQWGVRSAAIIPIVLGDSSDHFMAVTRERSEGAWSEEHLSRLRLLGEILVTAIERARADKELREGEAMLRSIISASPVGICFTRSDRAIQWVNDAVSHISWYTPDELIGQSTRVLYQTDEEFSRVGEALYGCPEGSTALNAKWVRQDGQVRDVEIRSAWITPGDISGGVVLVAQDITDRLQAEAAAGEAQSQVTALLESTEDMVWSVDPERFGLVTFNSALREYFLKGTGLSITLGMSPDDLVGGAFTREVAARWRGFYQRALRDGSFTEEYLVSAAPRILLLSFTLLKRNGVVFGISVFGKDITDRKRMEQSIKIAAEEWRSTFDAVSDVIVMLDRERKIVRMNRAAISFFSSPADEIVGSSCCAAMYGAQTCAEICPVDAMLKTKRHEEVERYDQRREAWFQISADPVFDDRGEISRIVHRVRDITDRKKTEMETFGAQREMLRLERLLLMGELSASLAHELNQPLTAILSNARAAARLLDANRLTAEELGAILDDIVRDDKRAGDIIRSLRSMLRREETETEIATLSEPLREAVSLFNSEAILRNIRIDADIPPSLPFSRFNRVQIQQVLINLMMNGAESMEDLPVSKRRLTIQATAGEYGVLVSVHDFGKGIDEADMKRLFEPFYTTKASGLGMGLPLSRSIVESHGGHIWATNHEDGGAVFFFDLPVHESSNR